MSKAANRRKKKQRRQIEVREIAPANTTAAPVIATVEAEDNRPTAERRARGIWHLPTGQGKSDRPMFDRAEDMIGRLYAEGQIDDGQEMAARQWQEVHAAYRAELDVKSYRSCLDISSGGYDGGDGNPRAVAEYRRLTKALGASATAILSIECAKGPERQPQHIAFLRIALDRLRDVG
jgi:hypothetical protein